MVIDRYLIREIGSALLAVLGVLLLIFMSKHFVRYMSDAAAGELPAYLIAQLLGLFTLAYLPLLIPFALFIAVLIAMGRLYKDSEMTALAACGIGIPRILQTALGLGLVTAVLVGVMSFWLAPWAERMQYELRDRAAMESEFSFLAPGRFHPVRGGGGVFYLENMSQDKRQMREVFVFLQDERGEAVFSAARAHQYLDPDSGSRYLVLEDGYRFERLAGEQGFRFYQYAASGVRVEPRLPDAAQRPRIAWPGSRLLEQGDAASWAELHWRIAMPVSALLLVLLAVLLSRTDPRQGRFGKLFLALLVYIAYFYLLTLGRAWLKDGLIPLSLGLWWAHGLALALVVILLGRQLGWRNLFARRFDAPA